LSAQSLAMAEPADPKQESNRRHRRGRGYGPLATMATVNSDAASARMGCRLLNSCQALLLQRRQRCDPHFAGRGTTSCFRSERPGRCGVLAGSVGTGSADRS
jgi:hypothetical protein